MCVAMRRLFEKALALDFMILQLRSIQEFVSETVIDWVTNDVQIVFQR